MNALPPRLKSFDAALNAFIMIMRIDTQLIIREVNDLFCETSGYTRADLLGHHYRIIQSDFHGPAFYEKIEKTLARGESWKGPVRRRRKNGTFYWADCTVAPICDADGTVQEVVIFSFDITQKMETEEKFNLAQTAAKIGSWTLLFEHQKLEWTPQMYEIFGFDPNSPPPRLEDVLARILPEDRVLVDPKVELCRQKGTPYSTRYRVSKGGQTVWIESHGHALYDENGHVFGLFGVCQDITRYAELELDLQNAKTSLQATLDNMPAVVYSKAPDGRFLLANTQFYEAVPYAQDVIGRYSSEFMPEETFREHQANDAEVLRTGRNINVVESVRQPDGKIRYYDSYKFPILNNQGQIVAINGISIDITERKQKQEELDRQRALAHHQLRLASIGELAAGVGHEINNPLTIVMSFLHQIDEQLRSLDAPPTQSLEMISKALRAGERIRNIVGGLRTFARVGEESKCQFPLLRAVQNSVNLVKGIFAKEGIEIIIENPDPSLQVFGDEGQIQQVLMNLLSNARDAVLTAPSKRIHLIFDSSSTVPSLLVRDSGVGIPAQAKARIFDPFFTTKPVLKGTGLGLSIAQSIMRDHGGEIACEKSDHAGTTFRLTFPRQGAPSFDKSADLQPKPLPQVSSSAPDPDESPRAQTPPPKKYRVLVADDEEDIVEILILTLEGLGFEARGAHNGQEALALMSKENFDILITDMNMPLMKGDRLIRILRDEMKLRQLKVFVITGGINFNLDEQDADLKQMIDGYFYKPFDHANLKTTLFSALGL